MSSGTECRQGLIGKILRGRQSASQYVQLIGIGVASPAAPVEPWRKKWNGGDGSIEGVLRTEAEVRL
jgi:hypothetical protein